jgi:hypothetical protein
MNFALLAGLWLWSAPALACSCRPLTPAEFYAQAFAVLEARVVAVRELPPAANDFGARRSVRVRVVRAWKGVEGEEIELFTYVDSATCGYTFEVDQSYLVYATKGRDDGLWVGQCGGTRTMATASEQLKALGMGATTVDPSTDQPASDAKPPAKAAPAHGGCASCSVRPAETIRSAAFALMAPGLLLVLRLRRARQSRAS